MGICKLETRGVSPSSPALAVSAYPAWFMYYCQRHKKKNVMCSRAESIWFSTSALIEKLSGLSHSDPVYGCIPLWDGLNWNTTKWYSCQVVWLLCACVVLFRLQGTCSRPRLEQQEASHIYVPLSGSPLLLLSATFLDGNYLLHSVRLLSHGHTRQRVSTRKIMPHVRLARLLVKNVVNSTKSNMSTKSSMCIFGLNGWKCLPWQLWESFLMSDCVYSFYRLCLEC